MASKGTKARVGVKKRELVCGVRGHPDSRSLTQPRRATCTKTLIENFKQKLLKYFKNSYPHSIYDCVTTVFTLVRRGTIKTKVDSIELFVL